MTCATPGTDSSRGRSTQSAYSRTAIALILLGSTGMAICMISPMIELIGPMCGVTPSGTLSSMPDNRSDTRCRARKMSVSQLKVTWRKDSPADEMDRTDSTPGRPFMAVSSGKVMSCSTSSAAMPPASVMMVTVGLLRSGNTSTGVVDSVNAP
jgi:hypothetical protein